MESKGLFIDGVEVAAASGATFTSVNPATGKPQAEYAAADAVDVDRAVAAARRAFEGDEWSRLSATERGRLLTRWGTEIERRADEIAAIEVSENGKLLREMRSQLRSIPNWLTYYAGLADKIEGRVIPGRTDVLNYTVREPLGVVGVIKPWNSPSLVTMFSVAPALAMGNTVVIKPSEFTPGSALELARAWADAGLPKGVVNVVTGLGATGGQLVADPRVAKVAFTGGSETGRAVAEGTARRLTSSVLELGGKNANIIFASADLEAAEAGLLGGAFAAAGQSCQAGSLALIQAPIFEQVVESLVARVSSIRLGDPMSDDTEMGPIANASQLQKIEDNLRAAVDAGAKVLVGGERVTVPGLPDGLFFSPTIVGGLDRDNPAVRREFFGPVLSVMPFEDEEEALTLANESRYGLAAGAWTSDVKQAHRVARRLEAGTVWVNMYRASSFTSPQGGYKDSGIGRENGIEGALEFVQTKSVWVELGETVEDPFVLRTS